jgi:HSP20 family protein
MFGMTPWKKKEVRSGERLVNDYPLQRFRDEFDSLFERFFSSLPTPFTDWQGTQPFWDFGIEDAGNEVVVRAEAPGFENHDFNIQVSGNQLTIHAERKHEGKGTDDGYNYSERRLHRSLTLPAGVDADKVEASYRNGVLELHFPKSPEAQGKRITVKS